MSKIFSPKIVYVSFDNGNKRYSGYAEIIYLPEEFKEELPGIFKFVGKFDFAVRTLNENGSYIKGMYLYVESKHLKKRI